jgi:hypothetical protein
MSSMTTNPSQRITALDGSTTESPTRTRRPIEAPNPIEAQRGT